jgi:hypothetical protein
LEFLRLLMLRNKIGKDIDVKREKMKRREEKVTGVH